MANVVVIGNLADSLIGFRGRLLQEMVEQGHRVLALAAGGSARTVHQLQNWGVSFGRVPLQRTGLNPLQDLRYFWAVLNILRRNRPDVVLAYTVKPNIYGSLCASLTGVPLAGSMITGLGHSFAGQSLSRRFLGSLVRTLYHSGLRRNRVVFFQNPDDMELFRSLGLVTEANHPTLINGSGVDTGEFLPTPLPSKASFLMICRLLREKGVEDFVAAAEILRRRHPGVEIRLAGFIDQNPTAITSTQLQKWQQQGDIEFLGRLDDVRPAISNASVFVLPSYYREGVPRVTLEAMAMGRPIITCDTPGCRETVRDGENGFLVPAQNPAALAAAMDRFIRNPDLIGPMGMTSRQLAVEKFDVDLVNRVILQSLGLRHETLH